MFPFKRKHRRKLIVKNGLVLYLDGKDFSNSPPASSWTDKSGNNNATPSNFAYTPSSGSDNNGGVVLDGVDDKATISNSSILKLGVSDFTLGFTFKTNSQTNYQQLLSRRNSASSNIEYYFAYNGAANSIDFKYSTDGVTPLLCSFPFTPITGQIYDLSLKRSGNNLYLYINSIQHTTVNTINGSLYLSNADLIIGALNSNGVYGSFLGGTIKRILQYNRALSNTEILRNYSTIK